MPKEIIVQGAIMPSVSMVCESRVVARVQEMPARYDIALIFYPFFCF